MEDKDGQSLPSYRGDIINGPEFTEEVGCATAAAAAAAPARAAAHSTPPPALTPKAPAAHPPSSLRRARM
jgi:hypothetical protein